MSRSTNAAGGITIGDTNQLEKIETYEIIVTDSCCNSTDSVIIEIGKVIVDIGDTTVQPNTESATVDINLINPEHHVRAMALDVEECQGGADNLVCTECVIDPARALDFTCSANEQPDGSCRVVLIDIPVSKLQGRGREFFFSELKPDGASAKIGFQKGLAGALASIKGKDVADATKMARDFATQTQMYPFTHSPYKILNKIAPVVEAPSRLLVAEDLIFRNMHFQKELHRQAIRETMKAGIRDKKSFAESVLRIVEDPTPEMIEKATRYAERATFTDPPGKITKSLMALRAHVPGSRLVVPFINTAANIMKRGAEMTPGSLYESK